MMRGRPTAQAAFAIIYYARLLLVGTCRCTCMYVGVHGYPGGKVRAISHEALAHGDIARDPTRSHQIPWLRVRLLEMFFF